MMTFSLLNPLAGALDYQRLRQIDWVQFNPVEVINERLKGLLPSHTVSNLGRADPFQSKTVARTFFNQAF